MNYSIISYKLNSDSSVQDSALQSNKLYAVNGENELNAEPEKELTKHDMPIENGALLMQKIWGDQFLSDSLH